MNLLTIEEKRKRQREATDRWRQNNPVAWRESQVRANEKRRGVKRYNPVARAEWYKRKTQDSSWKYKTNKQANDRNRLIKEYLAEYKLSKGCTDCGYKQYHTALDFDHITGEKTLNVCFAKSIAQAKKEIEKCEVVCANCHRVRTYNRLYPCKDDIFRKTYEEVID